MIVRPRLWRIGAAKEFLAAAVPMVGFVWKNAGAPFVRLARETQRKENWKRR